MTTRPVSKPKRILDYAVLPYPLGSLLPSFNDFLATRAETSGALREAMITANEIC